VSDAPDADDPSSPAAVPAAAVSIRFWGVRGSVPSPGPATARYGGNTSCVELRTADGRRLVLDAGTGLRALGDALMRGDDAGATVMALVTHGHADHLQGLPFFAPLARDGARVTLYAAAAQADAVADAARALLRPPLFPHADGLLDRLHVAALAAETEVAGFGVRPIEVSHPGGASGFRVRCDAVGRTVVYVSDNELAAVEGVYGGRRALLEAVADADVLIHDATYLPAELPAHRGWGHSSYAEAVRLAVDAGVRRLVLFHHHPARSDADIDRLTHMAQALAAASGDGGPAVTAAAEGDVLEL